METQLAVHLNSHFLQTKPRSKRAPSNSNQNTVHFHSFNFSSSCSMNGWLGLKENTQVEIVAFIFRLPAGSRLNFTISPLTSAEFTLKKKENSEIHHKTTSRTLVDNLKLIPCFFKIFMNSLPVCKSICRILYYKYINANRTQHKYTPQGKCGQEIRRK